MSFKKMPPPDVPPLTDSGTWTADYYDFLKAIDTLDALSGLAGAAVTLKGNPTGAGGPVSDIPLGAGLSFSGGNLVGTRVGGASGDITVGSGLTLVGQDLRVGLTALTNSIGADIALNNVANFFDGPSVAQGAIGTWFVSGTIVVLDVAQASILAKLWDGTTVLSSTVLTAPANFLSSLSLSGIITSPVGNLRISARDPTNATGLMKRNSSGQLLDSTITAIRIA